MYAGGRDMGRGGVETGIRRTAETKPQSARARAGTHDIHTRAHSFRDLRVRENNGLRQRQRRLFARLLNWQVSPEIGPKDALSPKGEDTKTDPSSFLFSLSLILSPSPSFLTTSASNYALLVSRSTTKLHLTALRLICAVERITVFCGVALCTSKRSLADGDNYGAST